jgi:hypothetical protein
VIQWTIEQHPGAERQLGEALCILCAAPPQTPTSSPA